MDLPRIVKLQGSLSIRVGGRWIQLLHPIITVGCYGLQVLLDTGFRIDMRQKAGGVQVFGFGIGTGPVDIPKGKH